MTTKEKRPGEGRQTFTEGTSNTNSHFKITALREIFKCGYAVQGVSL